MAEEANGKPAVDKDGLTEQEFLAAYKQKDYPKPALTADICVFQLEGKRMGTASTPSTNAACGQIMRLLLIQRGNHPFLGSWALPGGFVNPRETADQAAVRELAEETGVQGLKLERVGLYSDPNRDPRGWTVSEAFVAVDDEGRIPHAGDDAANAAWFAVEERERLRDRIELHLRSERDASVGARMRFRRLTMPITGEPHAELLSSENLAFDHAQIIADAYLKIAGVINR
ncbi:MAG: NUDIX domain-containing protein [Eggerthellaceae bacterium]|jgi:8-oxo-dGTP diphosphatase